MKKRTLFALTTVLFVWVAVAGAKEKKKVSYFYPESFVSAQSVDLSTGLYSNQQSTFNVLRDETVTIWLQLKYVPKASKPVKFIWYSPRGDKYHESKPIQLNKDKFLRKWVTVWQQIGLRNLDKLGYLGEWRVVAMVEGKAIAKEVKFTLVR